MSKNFIVTETKSWDVSAREPSSVTKFFATIKFLLTYVNFLHNWSVAMSLTTIITVSVCTFLFPFLSRIFCMLSFICGLITKQSRAYWSSSLLISCCNICHTPHSCTHAPPSLTHHLPLTLSPLPPSQETNPQRYPTCTSWTMSYQMISVCWHGHLLGQTSVPGSAASRERTNIPSWKHERWCEFVI